MVNAAGDNTENEKVRSGSYKNRRVIGVDWDEPALSGAVHFKPLDGELAVNGCNYYVSVMGFPGTVHDDFVSIGDVDVNHGVSGDSEDIGGCFVSDEDVVEVDGGGRVVLSPGLGRGKPAATDVSGWGIGCWGAGLDAA